MSAEKILHKIADKIFSRENLTAKLICLLLAIGFWIYVMVEQNPITERTLETRLLHVNVPNEMMIYNAPDKVQVRVRGNRDRLDQGVEEHLNVFVDFKGAKSGRQTLPVRALYDEGEVVAVRPETVTVYLDTVSQKTVPVEVRQTGRSEADYTLSNVKPTPEEVMVLGPSHRLDQVGKVAATVDITGREGSFATECKLAALDEEGKEVAGLRIMPADIMVEGMMVRQLLTVDLPVELSIGGRLPADLKLVRTELDPVAVRLTAPPSILNGLTGVKTKAVDLSGLRKSSTVYAELELPPKSFCRTKQVQVRLTVEKSER